MSEASGGSSKPGMLRHGGWRMQELGLVAVVVLLGALLVVAGYYNAGGRYSNLFLNFDNLFNGVATNMAIYAIMAVGMTVVIITGGIDISVGSIWALAALLTAWAIRVPLARQAEGSLLGVVLPAMAVSLSVGLACGLVNGLLVVCLRLHPFIVTLGTMSIFRGFANVISPEKSLPGQGGVLPDAFTVRFMSYEFASGLRFTPMLVTLLVMVLGWIFLRNTRPGRETYAIGGNEEASRFAGLNVGMIKLRVYVISGLCAGIAGLVSLGRFGAVSTNSGTGDELMVVASAVVGGASLMGGRGTALGALLGALVIQLIDNGIFVVGMNQEYKSIIIGSAIVVAVAVDRFSELLRQRRLVMAAAADK
ncbi:MAG: ABC transporter permease [Tepidisphaeraceae bacterium]|jgi:ribose/xylose/arabinose/galactoside ABC-type transport system permease subunit